MIEDFAFCCELDVFSEGRSSLDDGEPELIRRPAKLGQRLSLHLAHDVPALNLHSNFSGSKFCGNLGVVR